MNVEGIMRCKDLFLVKEKKKKKSYLKTSPNLNRIVNKTSYRLVPRTPCIYWMLKAILFIVSDKNVCGVTKGT